MPQARSSGPLLTIREASRATGLSVKALRGRVERGTLAAVLVDKQRRIPLSQLLEAGLLHREPPKGRKPRSERDRGTPARYPDGSLALVLERLETLDSALAGLERAVDGIRERASNVEADRERRRVLEARLDAALERIRELEAAARGRA